ncbi:MAG: purine-binding chemotaxis protein CheW [Rubrivivax sp.]|nr:purine-binding chemotaxis protein CheW [Rubrivivax sp.]
MSLSPSSPLPDRAGADAAGSEERSDNQFVTFSVAGEMFAVPMAPVQEIIRVPAVAQLPLAPPSLLGLANLRGRVLPIINLRRLFGCDEREHDDTTRALVIHIGQPLGFVVDKVASVVSVEPAEIEPAVGIHSVVDAGFLTGVIKRPRADGGTEMLLVVDFAHLIRDQFGAVGSAGSAGGVQGVGTAANAASATDEDGGGSDELRLVSFSVAGQEYALDITEVQEIVQLPEQVSVLPNAPAHVLGLMSLRQRLLPLVSLRALFGLPAVPYSEQQRIVVTALAGDRRVGLVTDSVKEVLSVPREQAEPMPGILAADAQLQEFASICRLEDGKRLVSIIATDQLLQVPGLGEAMVAAHEGAAGADPETTRMNAEAEDLDSSDDDDTQVVIFRLGAEEFGVPIMSVQEIVRVPEVLTRVPKTPAFVEGVINLRGTVLPVIDQRSRLGLPALPRSEGQRIMVYMLGGQRTGFIVDSVAEVLRIPRALVAPAPALSAEQSRLISRVANLQGDKRLVMLIDPRHLLQGGELQAVHGAAAALGEPAEPAPLAQAA